MSMQKSIPLSHYVFLFSNRVGKLMVGSNSARKLKKEPSWWELHWQHCLTNFSRLSYFIKTVSIIPTWNLPNIITI